MNSVEVSNNDHGVYLHSLSSVLISFLGIVAA